MSSEIVRGPTPLVHDILPFPDEQAGALRYASTGRNIALVLALTREPQVYSGREITDYFVSALKDSQRDPDIFTRGYAAARIKSWPDEVVTKIESDQDFDTTRWLYSATPRAREVDTPFAAQVAKKCWEYELSPALLVSPSGRPRKSDGLSPNITRLAMYDTLMRSGTDEELSISELAQRSRVQTRIIHNHIGSLAQAKIIDLSYNGSRSEYPRYTSNIGNGPDEISVVDSGFMLPKQRLADRIHDAIRDGEVDPTEIRVADIQELLVDEGSMADFTKSDQTCKQNEAIAEILEFLEEEGVLVETIPGSPRLDSLRMSVFGREVVGQYFSILFDLKNRNPHFLENGKRIAQEITSDSDQMGWLLTVDEDVGAIAPKRRQADRGNELVNIVGESELSTTEILERSGEKRRLTFKVLSELEESGKLTSRQLGRDVLWSRP